VHLDGFTIEIYHDTRSHERQKNPHIICHLRTYIVQVPCIFYRCKHCYLFCVAVKSVKSGVYVNCTKTFSSYIAENTVPINFIGR